MVKRFKKGTIIRNKLSGKPLLVIQSFNLCTLVVDLEAPSPTSIQALLTRDYDEWANDMDMDKEEKDSDGTIDWRFNPVTI